jgi:tetratricopeptide (TPR) repeat protein
MNILKALFGNSEQNPEEEKVEAEHKKFDLMKYDGVKAMKMGQWDYAVRCFEEALKLQDDPEVHDYLSQTFIRLDRLDEAVEQLQWLTRKEPENEKLLLQLAHVYYMKEDYEGMGSSAERAIQLNAESAHAYYLYAQAALGQNDMINGIARLTKAIALDEELADARLLRAQTLLKMGDVNGAADDSAWLMEHVGEQEDVLMLASQVARAKGDDGTAVELLKKALELNPFLLDNVSGDYEAEGIEEQTKRAYSMMNPFGI